MAKNKTQNTTPAVDALQKTVAKSYLEALGNVLTDVAKSAHKTVTDKTASILKRLQQSSSNWFGTGQDLVAIASAVNERQFSRLVNEVFSRFGLSKPTIYRWMDNVAVLEKAVPYEPARDALLTVFNGQGIVARKDGTASLTGPITAGIKKHPVPATGNYAECMDWAREVQLIAEKSAANSKQTMEEMMKSINSRFGKLLKKRYDLAVEAVVICYRLLEQTSEPLAAAAFEAIEDSSIAPATAGKNALAALKSAQTDKGTVIRHDTPTAA